MPQSTMFNALTRTMLAESANYPFCTIDPNTGIVPVPDPRLDKLVALNGSKRKVGENCKSAAQSSSAAGLPKPG